MIDNVNIYDDLDYFGVDELLKTKTDESEDLKDRLNQLVTKLTNLQQKHKKLNGAHNTLKRQAASLLITSKAEIQRNHNAYNALRREYEDVCFRRKIKQPLLQPAAKMTDSKNTQTNITIEPSASNNPSSLMCYVDRHAESQKNDYPKNSQENIFDRLGEYNDKDVRFNDKYCKRMSKYEGGAGNGDLSHLNTYRNKNDCRHGASPIPYKKFTSPPRKSEKSSDNIKKYRNDSVDKDIDTRRKRNFEEPIDNKSQPFKIPLQSKRPSRDKLIDGYRDSKRQKKSNDKDNNVTKNKVINTINEIPNRSELSFDVKDKTKHNLINDKSIAENTNNNILKKTTSASATAINDYKITVKNDQFDVREILNNKKEKKLTNNASVDDNNIENNDTNEFNKNLIKSDAIIEKKSKVFKDNNLLISDEVSKNKSNENIIDSDIFDFMLPLDSEIPTSEKIFSNKNGNKKEELQSIEEIKQTSNTVNNLHQDDIITQRIDDNVEKINDNNIAVLKDIKNNENDLFENNKMENDKIIVTHLVNDESPDKKTVPLNDQPADNILIDASLQSTDESLNLNTSTTSSTVYDMGIKSYVVEASDNGNVTVYYTKKKRNKVKG